MERNNAKVKVNGDRNDVYVNSHIVMNTAIDEVTKLISEGNTNDALELLGRLGRALSSQHPLYPDWRYQFTMGQDGIPTISHVPNNPEAAAKYPLKGSVSLIIPNEYKKYGSFTELLRYSYGKQIPLEFDAVALKTMIGDHIIEDIQASDERNIKVKMQPKKFPDAKPFKLCLTDDNSNVLDYLLLRLREIDGSTLYIDNSDQASAKITLSLKLDVETKAADLNLEIPKNFTNDIEAHFLLNKFVLLSRLKRPFALRSLEDGTDLLKAKEWHIDSKGITISGFRNFVKLLETLVSLESFYNVKFIMPENNFSHEDIEIIEILKRTSEGKLIHGTFTDISFNITNQETVKNIFKYSNANGSVIKVQRSKDIFELLGATITLNSETTFNNVVIDNADKLKMKLLYMDEGETVIVKFIPGSKNKVSQRYSLIC